LKNKFKADVFSDFKYVLISNFVDICKNLKILKKLDFPAPFEPNKRVTSLLNDNCKFSKFLKFLMLRE
jgi:hypothetical protein